MHNSADGDRGVAEGVVKQRPKCLTHFRPHAYLNAVSTGGCRLDKADDGKLVGDIPNGYFLPPLMHNDTYKAVADEVLTEAEFMAGLLAIGPRNVPADPP